MVGSKVLEDSACLAVVVYSSLARYYKAKTVSSKGYMNQLER
jgi:hypothetical protein